MPLRNSVFTRWIPQSSGLVQQMFPSPIIRSNLFHHNPSRSTSIYRPLPSPHHVSSLGGRFFSSSMRGQARPTRAIPRSQHQSFSSRRFFNSSRPKYSSHSGQPTSLSQRLKMLSREYGWSALGVYLLLSAMDFPFCFAAVHFMGADRIGHYEQVIVDSFKAAAGTILPSVQEEQAKDAASSESQEQSGSEVEQKKAGGDEASMSITLRTPPSPCPSKVHVHEKRLTLS